MKLKLNLCDLQWQRYELPGSWLQEDRFIETVEVSQRLHKTFHWLSGEGSYAHIKISSFSLVRITGFQGELGDGWGLRGGRAAPELMVCHDSSAWIKCGTLIWVKIMESYMSLSMSAFHSGPKWKATAGRGWGGGHRRWNGNQATTRLVLRLTCSQPKPRLTVIEHLAPETGTPHPFHYFVSLSALDGKTGTWIFGLTSIQYNLHSLISDLNNFFFFFWNLIWVCKAQFMS